ncbi:DUF5916 domain-containing protein [Sediminicola luteus]|uniref:Hydrolase n=1 Tax=Sediminicola luteus TaxID=319238 RepID=A0A2A4G633_9FLAO|nr:DUF5916 domain-containing protein [Sediminicola luteus]PCE63205.1 hydrolase [Sediminicola luteus]
MKSRICCAILLLFGLGAFAQDAEENKKQGENGVTLIPRRIYTTQKITGEAPKIDGLLNDAAWKTVDWGNDFIQWTPDEGEAPSYQTKFKILYDDKNIYFGVLSLDDEPDKIVKRLSRRDGFEGDWIEINIDSYHDLRTAFSFNLSAAGVKGDEFISNDGQNWDESWNPIWYAKAQVTPEGWVAEIRIPLSQLRFGNAEEQVWGLQVMRRFFRNEERSTWQLIPREENGWVSKFGELHGLKDLVPQKQLEIQPYMVASLDTYEKEEGNPFRDGSDYTLSGGIDGKVGVTNDLTLDFTINPDFGQVEADPSRIALDGFQIFFEERRPFFVENKNIFDYRLSSSEAGNTFGFDNLFYSRRIGRSPHGSPDLNDGEFADTPDNTTILGAAKFSGKTKDGWSIGVLESVTASEKSEIEDENGNRREVEVEPLTNYLVARLQKDFNDRNSYIGGIITATNRNLPENLEYLHKSAYTGGLDFKHRWNDRSWYVGGDVVFSQVRGTTEAITRTQQANEHNFDRVDASYLDVDPNATDLVGTGGNLQLGRIGKGIIFESGFTWRSPKLELNDIGFQRLADDLRHYTWAGYRITKPFSIFRRIQFNYNHWFAWDYGGNIKRVQWNTNTNMTFKNNWNAGTGFNYKPTLYNNTALRGGPRLKLNPAFSQWLWFNTDRRKKVYFNGFMNYEVAKQSAFGYLGVEAGVTYQPINALKLSVFPEYGKFTDKLQYVENVSHGDQTRYVNGDISQETLSVSLRLSYNINPDLTLQYWGQPFVSRGRYTDFKYVTDATAADFYDRFHQYTDQQIAFDTDSEQYEIDENNDGEVDYSFGDPNFSFVQFRSNLVLRWEYIPGSEAYFVWSQGVTGSGDPMASLGNNLDTQILGQTLNNTFLVKLTYRFIL